MTNPGDSGERSWSEIFTQIAQRPVFIYLLSSDSIESLACRAEFSEAVRLNKNIIPLIVHPSPVPTFIKAEYNFSDVGIEDVQDISNRISNAINKIASNLPIVEAHEPIWRKPDARQIESARVSVTVSVPVQQTTSGDCGRSYGESIPVNSFISPARALR